MTEKTAIISQQPTANSQQHELFPLISVIVPVYNTEKYLARCVSSILTQTYPNIELILIDDGSTDNSPAMCDDFARKDNRVKVIHQNNAGQAMAHNVGLEAAAGSLLAFVDSDDFILPGMYSKLYAIMRDNDADISMCGYVYTDEAGNIIQDKRPKQRQDETITGEEALRRFFTDYGYGDYCLIWEKLHKAEIFRDIRFPAGNRHDDSATAHRRFGAAKKVAITGEVFYFYCQRENSVMGNIRNSVFSLKRFQDLEYIHRDRFAYISNIDMSDALEFIESECYSVTRNALHKVNCLQYWKDIMPFFFFTFRNLIRSKSYRNKLRAVKLILLCGRSLFRPFQKWSVRVKLSSPKKISA